MGHEVQYKKCQIMSIASEMSHPTYLYNLCGHVLFSVQIAKYLGITLIDELSWSSHVHSIHSRANSTLGFLRRNLRSCSAKLKETAYITLVRSTLEYAASIWDPHLAKDCDLLEKLQRRSARFVKGITGQHPVCPKCCMILAGVALKTAGGTLDWLCSTRLSLGMWPLIQIRLIWWLQTTGPEQIIDNKFRAIGASNWAALLVCCQNPQ